MVFFSLLLGTVSFMVSDISSKKAALSRFQRLAVEGGWVVLGQIAAALGALALVRALTEYLEPAQYGQLALGLTVASLVNQVIMGGVTAGIGRFYSIAAEKNDLLGYMNASLQLMGYASEPWWLSHCCSRLDSFG